FERLVGHLRARVRLVSAIVQDYGWFLANGGAVRFERIPLLGLLPASGLVEGATPECRGPRQLLLYQRAQDVLLSRAAAASGGSDGVVSLLKNNRDARGSCYGSHENYEATVAAGVTLFLWRLGLVLLLPAVAVPVVLAAVVVFFLFAILLLPAIFL